MLATRTRQINPVTGEDPNFASVSLLLHMDGSNGGTTFTDKSNNALTVSVVGSAQTDTSIAKFGTASAKLGSGANYLTVPSSSLFDFGTGDFTIEFWFYTTVLNQQFQLFSRAANQSGSLTPIFIERKSNNTIGLSWTSTGSAWVLDQVSGATTLAASTWHHVAVTRASGTFNIWINGTSDYSNSSSSAAIQDGGDVVAIGRWPKYTNSSGPYYIDDFRITKGVARYTANFTVPSSAFPDS